MDNRDFKALLDVLERIAVALEKIANSKSIEVESKETINLSVTSPYENIVEKKKLSGKSFNYRASIVGFHNPHKHKDLTPDEFLMLYVARMRAMSKKKDGQARVTMAQWVEDNWETQLKFVSRLFPNTLNENNKSKK